MSAPSAQQVCLLLDRLAREAELCLSCGGNHQTYNCCEACNIDRHLCAGCGDNLGHLAASECYGKCKACGRDIWDHNPYEPEGALCTTPEPETAYEWLVKALSHLAGLAAKP